MVYTYMCIYIHIFMYMWAETSLLFGIKKMQDKYCCPMEPSDSLCAMAVLIFTVSPPTAMQCVFVLSSTLLLSPRSRPGRAIAPALYCILAVVLHRHASDRTCTALPRKR